MATTMMTDLIFQAIIILVMLFMFLWTLNIPQKYYDKFQFRDRSSYAAKRHFVRGADFLSKSRTYKNREFAKSAVDEAEKSIAINPKDAAAHILKALALDAQGFTTSALEAMDIALSPLTKNSLCDEERSDGLVKRAEIKVKAKGVDSAVVDLVEAVRLNEENVTALRLLGECYEKKGMREEAVKAYMDVVKVEPQNAVAQTALKRLGSI
uniref:uncharacterized protein LOC122607740 n=1 Tax=Erigeron canadensis TaxID=72917 RepID=UPI001CB95169|nr:uncharacterized protein LOC122607740 [Erigeron canadensis]